LLIELGTIVFATSVVQLANGFFTTFVSLRLQQEDFDTSLEGLILSSYFIGFTIGSAVCGRIIQRVGHIRSYAAFAGIVVGAAACMGMLLDQYLWILLRAAVGFGCVGLFVTTESWLNSKASPAARGRIFSFYMVGTFMALGLGQLLVGRIALTGGGPVHIIVVLFAIALVMVSMTRAGAPPITEEEPLPWGEFRRAAPLAILGAAVSGMVAACVYAVVPAWMLASGIPQERIGYIMLSVVLGGLACQVPVGLLSDRMDRRLLICLLALGLSVTAIVLSVLPRQLIPVMAFAALLGGLMSTIYPVCVALTLDHVDGGKVVSASSRLILISGIGSVIGPFASNWLMDGLDIDGVLYLLAVAAAILALAAGLQAALRPRKAAIPATFTVMAPQAVHPAPHDAVAEAAPTKG